MLLALYGVFLGLLATFLLLENHVFVVVVFFFFFCFVLWLIKRHWVDINLI